MVEANQANATERSVLYAKWREDKNAEPGYSKELINIQVDPKHYDDIEGHLQKYEGCETYLDHFERQVKIRKNHPFLGSRTKLADGSFGAYEWQTYGQIEQIAQNIARGSQKLGLTVKTEGDGRQWNFVGIWAKNRWEWLATHLANMYFTVTTIGFFDSMGAGSVDYILNQTELTSIFASNDYITKILTMKKDGIAANIKNLVAYDDVSAD